MTSIQEAARASLMLGSRTELTNCIQLQPPSGAFRIPTCLYKTPILLLNFFSTNALQMRFSVQMGVNDVVFTQQANCVSAVLYCGVRNAAFVRQRYCVAADCLDRVCFPLLSVPANCSSGCDSQADWPSSISLQGQPRRYKRRRRLSLLTIYLVTTSRTTFRVTRAIACEWFRSFI